MKKLKMDQSSRLGMPPWHPPLNIKNHQASKLGEGMPWESPPLHRLSWGRLRWTKFLSLYILYAMFRESFCFQFCLFVCWSYPCWILALFVWERDTLRFFIWILLCFTYILLSILSYCLFASKLSLLVFILFREIGRASCRERVFRAV